MTSEITNLGLVYIKPEELKELRDAARLWRRVKEIAARDNSEECDKSCPYYDPDIVDQCKIFGGCPFCQVFDALTAKEPT